jgi:hypothetical protein
METKNFEPRPLYQPGEGCQALLFDLAGQGNLLQEFPGGLRGEADNGGLWYPVFRHGLILTDASAILSSRLYGFGLHFRPVLDLSIAASHPGFPYVEGKNTGQPGSTRAPATAKDLTEWTKDFYGKTVGASYRLPELGDFLIGGEVNGLDGSVYAGGLAGSGWLTDLLNVHYANVALASTLTSSPGGGSHDSRSTALGDICGSISHCLNYCTLAIPDYRLDSAISEPAEVLISIVRTRQRTYRYSHSERCEIFTKPDPEPGEPDSREHSVQSSSERHTKYDGGVVGGCLAPILSSHADLTAGTASDVLAALFSLGDPFGWVNPFDMPPKEPPVDCPGLASRWPESGTTPFDTYGSPFTLSAARCAYWLMDSLLAPGAEGATVMSYAGAMGSFEDPKKFISALGYVDAETPEVSFFKYEGDTTLSVRLAKEQTNPCDPTTTVLGCCDCTVMAAPGLRDPLDEDERAYLLAAAFGLNCQFSYECRTLAEDSVAYKHGAPGFHDLGTVPKGQKDLMDPPVTHRLIDVEASCTGIPASKTSFETAKPIVSAPFKPQLMSQIVESFSDVINRCVAVVYVPFEVTVSMTSNVESGSYVRGLSEVKFDDESHPYDYVGLSSESGGNESDYTSVNAQFHGVLRVRAKPLVSSRFEDLDGTPFGDPVNVCFQLERTKTELAVEAFEQTKPHLPAGVSFPITDISFSASDAGGSGSVSIGKDPPFLKKPELPNKGAGSSTGELNVSVVVGIGRGSSSAVYDIETQKPEHLVQTSECSGEAVHDKYTGGDCSESDKTVDDEEDLPDDQKKKPDHIIARPINKMFSYPWIAVYFRPAFARCL